MLHVHELSKAAWLDCDHLCSAGCGVYEERFSICKAFRCVWLQGQYEDSDRPDLLGVLFNVRPLTSDERQTVGSVTVDGQQRRTEITYTKIAIVATETRLGALAEPRAQELVHRTAQFYSTFTTRYGAKELCYVWPDNIQIAS